MQLLCFINRPAGEHISDDELPLDTIPHADQKFTKVLTELISCIEQDVEIQWARLKANDQCELMDLVEHVISRAQVQLLLTNFLTSLERRVEDTCDLRREAAEWFADWTRTYFRGHVFTGAKTYRKNVQEWSMKLPIDRNPARDAHVTDLLRSYDELCNQDCDIQKRRLEVHMQVQCDHAPLPQPSFNAALVNHVAARAQMTTLLTRLCNAFVIADAECGEPLLQWFLGWQFDVFGRVHHDVWTIGRSSVESRQIIGANIAFGRVKKCY